MGELKVIGGALEGAERFSRELATFSPRWGSPDQIINASKEVIDGRSNDTAQDDALAQGAITTHRDNIVGGKYTLNCKPDLTTLGVDPDHPWVEEFQRKVEALWNAIAESPACWLDAGRRRTFTQMCRLGVSSIALSGEILATAEWMTSNNRPLKTAINMVSPARLSNPNGIVDTRYLRRGIEKSFYGEHVSYWFRQGFPGEWYDARQYQWRQVPAELPWGRKQVIYITDPLLVEQTRGVGDMSAAMVHMRMSKKHGEITMQNAVINATYAACVESDLPPPEIAVAMGAAQNNGVVDANQVVEGWEQAIAAHMAMLGAYLGASQNIGIDGAKMPMLPSGAKFKLLNAGNGGSNFEAFQRVIDRKTAAGLGMSYEEYSRDYSQLSYSGGKMSAGKTERFMNGRKAMTIDRFACDVFTLVLEELIAQDAVPLPPSWSSRDDYYLPFMKEAISRCSWIGTGKGQIDEYKETQAAMLRIQSGLSTWEAECARLGNDFREVYESQKRERAMQVDMGLTFSTSPTKPDGQQQDPNAAANPDNGAPTNAA